jgi:hypothetical protein
MAIKLPAWLNRKVAGAPMWVWLGAGSVGAWVVVRSWSNSGEPEPAADSLPVPGGDVPGWTEPDPLGPPGYGGGDGVDLTELIEAIRANTAAKAKAPTSVIRVASPAVSGGSVKSSAVTSTPAPVPAPKTKPAKVKPPAAPKPAPSTAKPAKVKGPAAPKPAKVKGPVKSKPKPATMTKGTAKMSSGIARVK